MERHSTRATGPSTELPETPDDDMNVDSEYEDPHGRGKKRKSREDKVSKQGHPTKKIRGKRGLLRQLVEMPLDVLFEIFGNLKPLDLLHLARTTKNLRAVLMSRSSTSIWKHARSQLNGAPDCPDDLSEPQYAELLFGRACAFCHRNLLTNMTFWTIRVRTCSRCLSTHFSQYVLNTYPRRLLDYIQVSTWVKSRRHHREKYTYPEWLHERWQNEYNALPASDRDNWVTQKIAERKVINAHAKLCETWVESVKAAQEMEKTAVIDHRKAMIIERVKTLGWADELSKMDSHHRLLDHDPFVVRICQKEITNRILLEVDEFINSYMENIKLRRLQKERSDILGDRLPILRKVYSTWISTYPVNSIIPSSADVFLDPLVHDLIINTPSTVTFTVQSFEAIEAAFPDIVLRWRKLTEEKLLNMITKNCDTQNAESMFKLATTVFSCISCSTQPLTYPRVLVHQCATSTSTYYQSGTEDEDISAVRRFLFCQYWNYNAVISFEAQRILPLIEAINLCGLDPKSATAEDVDKRNAIFECVTCNDPYEGRCTLTWQGVFVHQRRHSSSTRTEFNLKLLNEEDTVKMRDKITELSSRATAQPYFKGLICVHCKERGDIMNLVRHVKENHKKAEPTNEDIVPVIDYNHVQSDIHWLWPPYGMPNLTIV